jgi:hypothetical protein
MDLGKKREVSIAQKQDSWGVEHSYLKLGIREGKLEANLASKNTCEVKSKKQLA